MPIVNLRDVHAFESNATLMARSFHVGGQLGAILDPKIGDNDVRAVFEKLLDFRGTESLRAAGDDRNLAVHVETHRDAPLLMMMNSGEHKESYGLPFPASFNSMDVGYVRARQ